MNFGRAVPDGIEWDWREDGFTWKLLTGEDRDVYLHIGPRLRFDFKFWIDRTDTEWGPAENGNMEPKAEYRWRQLNIPLFGWAITLTATDYS